MASPGVVNPTGFTDHDANNLARAFGISRSWNFSGVSHTTKGQDIGADGLPMPDPVGIQISATQEHLDLARCVQSALSAIGVESEIQTKKSGGNSLDILVGNAP
jgi:hypothetical protein